MDVFSLDSIFFLCSGLVFFVLFLLVLIKFNLHDKKTIFLLFFLGLGFLTGYVGFFFFNQSYFQFKETLGDIIRTLYFMGHISIPVFLNSYIYFSTGQHYRKKTRYFWIFYCLWLIPILTSDILLILNSITPTVFIYEEKENAYKLLWGFYWLMASGLFYLVVSLYYLIRYHQSLKRGEFFMLCGFFFCFFTFYIFDYFSLLPFDCHLFVESLLSIGIVISSQDPTGEIDSLTEFGNQARFNEVTKKSLKAKAHYRLILLRITNAKSINTIILEKQSEKISKEIALRLKNLHLKNCEFFHLAKSTYAINSYEKNKDSLKSRNDLNAILGCLSKDILLCDMAISMNIEAIYLHVPTDVDSLEKIEKIIQSPYSSPYQRVTLLENDAALRMLRKGKIAKSIHNGLKENRFYVVYQPIYDTEEQKITTAEALLRLRDDELGEISPGEFIPIAEESGDILSLGLFVFSTVCKDIKERHLLDYGLNSISLNLSKRQFVQADLAECFAAILKKYEICAKNIILEITESISTLQDVNLLNTLHDLEDLGFIFSMDDYGTGYSNFEAIVGPVEFSTIKIDKSILYAGEKSESGNAILETNIHLINQLNMHSLVEGVETKDQKTRLEDLGCHYLQGFYFSRPIEVDSFINYIASFNQVIHNN